MPVEAPPIPVPTAVIFGGVTATLPEAVRRYFWDVDVTALSWPRWREFIIRRLLRVGDWHAVQWLRAQVTPAELTEWLRAHQGGVLSPQRLRYWQLVLDLPASEVDEWIATASAESWGARIRR